MAGYPKIWTSILGEDWFVRLTLAERGFFLQLILLAKQQGEEGRVVVRGWSGLGSACGCDRGTAAKFSVKFQQIGKIIVAEKSARTITIIIPKFKKYQALKKWGSEPTSAEKSTHRPPQAEQSRADYINRQAEGKVDNVDNNSRTVTFSASVQSAYLKKFGKELEKMDYGVLLKKYGDEDLLKFMIENITMNNEFRNPIGMLITARKAPGSHLPDSKPQHDYDAWKMLIRQISDRKS